MKRKCTLATLALALLIGHALRGAEPPQTQVAAPPAVLESAPEGTVVFDDDGGRAQVVPRQGTARGELSFHGGPVVSRGNVQAIFLGSRWREDAIRRKETRVMEALSGFGRSEALASLSRYGIEARELPGAAHEDLVDPLEGRKMSDLQIQARLDRLFQGGTMGALESSAVYIVFLAPGIQSTLGSSTSDKDFSAYHNHFHSSAGVVRYVVVPYDDEFPRWLSNAQQSLTQALVNPEGSGWY